MCISAKEADIKMCAAVVDFHRGAYSSHPTVSDGRRGSVSGTTNPVNPAGLDPEGSLHMADELGPVVRDKGVFTKAVRLPLCRLEGAAEGQPPFRTAVLPICFRQLLDDACPNRCMSSYFIFQLLFTEAT